MADRSSAPTQPDGDREFELVLGNKQLFSLLFIMFALLGVFFAMGYTLGRTSAPPEGAATASAGAPQTAVRPAQRPSVVDGVQPDAKPADEKTDGSAGQRAAAASGEPSATSATAPSRTEDSPVTPTIDPKPGQTFMQVSAVARPEAELLVEVLSKKGFPAAIAPGPSDKLFRVLVGPAATDTDLAKLKAGLEQSGFKPLVRRY